MTKENFISNLVDYHNIQLDERSRQQAEELYDAFNALSGVSNTTLKPNQEIINQAFIAGCGHRTLEQNVMRFIFGLLEFLAENADKTDLRNEDSRKVAKQMVELFKDSNGGNLPSQMLRHI